MSTNYKYFVALLATALLAVVATDAGAVIITNVTAGTTLFSDDFEGVSAINLGFADDPGTDLDPAAAPGTWTIVESDATQIQVTEFAGTTSTSLNYPGAFQGDNYLWINRTGGFNRASGDFTPQTVANNWGWCRSRRFCTLPRPRRKCWRSTRTAQHSG